MSIYYLNFPQTVLALRGSGGFSIGTGWSVCGLCAWSAPAHFCCYFTYFVHVTFATLQRIGRFFQICCKLQYKINVFDLIWSLVHLGQVSGMLRMIFLSNFVDNLTKYEQKCNFCKMGMSSNFRNASFSEIKAPMGAS